jgi:hypothetical protein
MNSEPPKLMTHDRRSSNLLAALRICGILSLLCTSAFAQLPQLDNGIRNIFTQQGVPADPEPPGPTARTGTQFSSGTVYGGWFATRIKDGSGTVLAGSTNESVGAPGTITTPSYTPLLANGSPDSGKTIRMDSVRMSRPFVLRTVSFFLGSEIARPDRKPDGTQLNPNNFAEAEFYLKEPANSGDGDFYWSPHAQKVFATEPGSIRVDWKERVSGDIFTQTYSVSGSGVKEAKKLYWTENPFNGPLVEVPESRIGEINVVYNTNFAEKVLAQPAALTADPSLALPVFPAPGELVSFDYDPDDPYDSQNPGIRSPPEVRTLWYDTIDKSIHAYNIEGRVFVELLGDLIEPERIHREHLGFEIVDVIREIRPEEVKVAIGERVLPVNESQLTEEDEVLVAEVVAGLGLEADPYLFEHLSLGGTKRSFYAIRETTPIVLNDRNEDGVINQLDEQQSNEVLIYWKEKGVMQLEWPKEYVGYIFKWPEEYLTGIPKESDLREFYSLFARPEGGSADFDATGVQLDSADNPVLTYQDDPTRQHARVTAQNIFYTTPGTGNRSLIRYTDGEEIWFERVYSLPNTDFLGYHSTVPTPVGSRIDPPVHLPDAVGYFRQTSGNAFNPNAYIDPFVDGLEAAANGAIIGVNTVPGNEVLEVWWYEPSTPGLDTFSPTYWPSSVRSYQLYLPSLAAPAPLLATPTPAEIVNVPGILPSYDGRDLGGVNNVDTKDATFVLDVDFADKTTGDPEILWETGGTGIGSALLYDVGNVLRLGWKVTPAAILEVSHSLTAEQIDDGLLRVAWIFDINGSGDETLSLFINGVEVETATSNVGSDWSGSNGANLGKRAGNNAFALQTEDFTSGTIGPLLFFANSSNPLNPALTPGVDDDFDTLPDHWERAFFPLDLSQLTPGSDFDGDGYSDEEEYLARWDPTRADSDGDGVTDDLDSNAFPEPIVMASNAGSGELGIAAIGTIYRQPDPALPGYNPNEEHALMSGGVAWALRDDLNITSGADYSSEAFVLVDYIAEDGRPAMVFRQVLREDSTYTFDYDVPVGRILQAPMPLPVMPLPLDDIGNVANEEVGASTDVATNKAGTTYYDRFTYVDRKGSTWIYRGPHAEGVNVGSVTDVAKSFTMHYFYKTQSAFDFPGLIAPELGTIIPYLSQVPVADPIESLTPADINFTPLWPDDAPILQVAETLGKPKFGLPAVRGQSSAQLLYEQSRANASIRSAKLIDPTRAKVFPFEQRHLDAMGLLVTSGYQGKTYFPQLPPHLSERLFYDPNDSPLGSLIFIGEFVDEPLGEDYFLLNVMSPQDILDAKDLAVGDADGVANWGGGY